MTKKKKIEWEEIARRGRAQPVILIDLMTEEVFRDGLFGKFVKTNWKVTHYRQFDSARWMSVDDINKFKNILLKKEGQKPGYLLSLAKEFISRENKFVKFAESFQRKDFQKMNNKELAAMFNVFWKEMALILAPDYTYILINRFYPDFLTKAVADKIKDIHRQTKIFSILFSADKILETKKEKISILGIALNVQKFGWDKNNLIALERHFNNFTHLGAYIFLGSFYTIKDFKNRIQEYLKKDIKTEIKSLRENIADKSEKIMKELNFSHPERLMVKTIKSWVFAAGNLEDSMNLAFYKLNLFFREIEKRLKITWEEFREMRGKEVYDSIIRGGISPGLLNKIKLRKKENVVLWENGKVSVMEGVEVKKYRTKEEIKSFHKYVKELRGQAVSVGTARSRVRLVRSNEDISKVQRGEILVAASTNPTYVPAMERAAAIITNEGGLLCHAAIVSRELKIPCIVGTKIATKVLKDGDLVEVDANKGIVKILKN